MKQKLLLVLLVSLLAALSAKGSKEVTKLQIGVKVGS